MISCASTTHLSYNLGFIALSVASFHFPTIFGGIRFFWPQGEECQMMIHIFTKIFCCLRPNTGEMAPLPMAHMLVERRRALPPHHMGGTLASPSDYAWGVGLVDAAGSCFFLDMDGNAAT